MAKDRFHYAVKNALQKEGWTITHDPLKLRVQGVNLEIDLGAEKLIGAEKNGQQIAVEVKSFIAPSAISEFHTALGQFINYQDALVISEPHRLLYLAVPNDVYNSFFQLIFVQNAIRRYRLSLVIYEPRQEVIIKWTS